jgi:hypothetical protein
VVGATSLLRSLQGKTSRLLTCAIDFDGEL